MSIFLTLFLFSSVALANEDRDFCFPTQKQALMFQYKLEVKAHYYWSKLFFSGKVSRVKPRFSLSKNCDNCLSFEGDPYIKGAVKEDFAEEMKGLDKKLQERPVKNLKMDVTVGGLFPDEKVNEKVFFNKMYKPYLRFPDQMQNVFYDKDHSPIYVSARMINEEVMGYTFSYKDQKHIVIQEVNEPVLSIFPFTKEFDEKYPDVNYFKGNFFIKEDDKYLPVKDFRLLSIIRDFYWPQENVTSP